MGQTESTLATPDGEPGVVTTPSTLQEPTFVPPSRPAGIPWYDLKIAPDYLIGQLERVADVLTKKKVDLFRPADAAELPGFDPGRKTIFIELDNLLTLMHRNLPKHVTPHGVMAANKKRNVIHPKIRTKPFSRWTYERLPDEYALGARGDGPPFPREQHDRLEFLLLRRHTRKFLRTLRSDGAYQVIAYTGLVKERADAIIDFIEGRGPESEGETLFDGRLYQENCCWVPVQPAEEARQLLKPDMVVAFASNAKRVHYVKSLANAVPSADPKNFIILDSNPGSCAAHLKNSLCLTKFEGEDDDYLLSVLSALMSYTKSEDIQEVIMKTELNRAWISYQHKQRHSLPDLSKEGDGGLWMLKNPISYEPELLTAAPITGRKISFGGISFQAAPSKDASPTPLSRPTLKRPLRSILKKQGQPSRPTEDAKFRSGLEVQITKGAMGILQDLVYKLGKQLALQKEISLLLAGQVLDSTARNEPSVEAESCQYMMGDLKSYLSRLGEIQRKVIVSCTS